MITGTKKKHSFAFVHRTILIWPAVILMLIFFIAPILLTFVYSFTNLALTGSAAKDVKIIWFDNYIKMFKNPDVWLSIKATLIFLLGSVIGQQLLGFFIAFMMKNTRVGFRRAVGPCILAGWVMPELVAAMCLYAFFADNGTLNTLLTAVFGIKKIAWLYKHAMLCVVLANIWHGTAFSMLMYQAALDNVPHDMEEAAIIDGANRWQVLRYLAGRQRYNFDEPDVKHTLYPWRLYADLYNDRRRTQYGYNDIATIYVSPGICRLSVGVWYSNLDDSSGNRHCF